MILGRVLVQWLTCALIKSSRIANLKPLSTWLAFAFIRTKTRFSVLSDKCNRAMSQLYKHQRYQCNVLLSTLGAEVERFSRETSAPTSHRHTRIAYPTTPTPRPRSTTSTKKEKSVSRHHEMTHGYLYLGLREMMTSSCDEL